jgi:hypothetical protein
MRIGFRETSRRSDALEAQAYRPTDSDRLLAEFAIAGDQDRVKITALMCRIQRYNCREGALSAAGSVASDDALKEGTAALLGVTDYAVNAHWQDTRIGLKSPHS